MEQIDATKVTVNPAALECPSRICLLPAQAGASSGNVRGLCTAECSSNDDCADGEKGNEEDPNSARCKLGFVCRIPIAKLMSNALSCKSLCVCSDFLSVQERMTGSIPEGCK